MTSLKLSLEMLQAMGRAAADPQTGRLLELVHRQSERLERLIQDLLDATRIDLEQLRLERSNVDLSALVREVAARFDPDLKQSGSTLTLELGPPIVGAWDRSRLDQVVTNLISNAIKFGEGRPISIAVATIDGRARLAVTDHGIGIPEDRGRRLFERFDRAVLSARHYGGLGLGLYISRRIAEAHGGTIRFESKVGEGTTFFVELPLAGPS